MTLPHIEPLYSFSGLLVGFLVGLTGVGGGSLMTPLLVLVFGVHPATAVGTDLLYAAATKSVGTFVHGFKGTVDWRVTRRLATGSVPATVITLLLLHHYGKDSLHADHLFSILLGSVLLVTALSLVFRHRLLALAKRRHNGAPPNEMRTLILTIVTGAVLGALVSLTSVGAGAIGVTVLLLLYPKLPTARIVGSDIAHAVPLTLLAGAGYWWLGSINWMMLLSLLCGSIPGIVVGSLLSQRVPDALQRILLAFTLTLVGVRMLLA